MKIFYSDHHLAPLPPAHRFPMPKYARLRQRLLESGWIPEADWAPSDAASDEQLLRVHTPDYLRRLVTGEISEREMRRIGFPWSPGLVERSRRSVGGTIGACRAALEHGIAANLAGGTHHAYPDHGEGYCIFNDVAVALRVLQLEQRLQRAVILDCDVHQGDGSAAIFQGDETVFTFSVHGQKNFPYHKEQGSLDIALPDATGDEAYLQAVRFGVEQSLSQANAQLAVYIAGADPFAGDQLGRMAVSKAGLAERDQIVFDLIQAWNLPVAIVLGGGYAKDIQDTVEIHTQTIQLALQRQPWPGR